jgi:hypothetical protein
MWKFTAMRLSITIAETGLEVRECDVNDIVAVAVELASGRKRYYMTWGRIQHPSELEPLAQLVLRYCVRDNLEESPLKASVCRTLQEASHAPYFYEAFFSFCQKSIPVGDQYEVWRRAMDERMQCGEEIYDLGCPEDCAKAETDWITVIESHIDNMSGELLGGFMERLFTLGALDVSYTPIQMKKNRPATLLTVLCPSEIGEQLALSVLEETTTLGVRIQQVRRLKAQRYQETIPTSLGPVLVKTKRLGLRVVGATPEYEECQRIAREHNISLVDAYEIVRVAIQHALR